MIKPEKCFFIQMYTKDSVCIQYQSLPRSLNLNSVAIRSARVVPYVVSMSDVSTGYLLIDEFLRDKNYATSGEYHVRYSREKQK